MLTEEETDLPAREQHQQSHGGGGVACSWNMQFLCMVVIILSLHMKFDHLFKIVV